MPTGCALLSISYMWHTHARSRLRSLRRMLHTIEHAPWRRDDGLLTLRLRSKVPLSRQQESQSKARVKGSVIIGEVPFEETLGNNVKEGMRHPVTNKPSKR